MIVRARELRKAGLRATTPRLHVLQTLEESPKRHLSAEDIHNALMQKQVDIGYATIYRILTQFAQAGVAIRHLFDNGPALYELADSNHHDHMICLDTGRVIEFQNEQIEVIQQQIAEEHDFDLVDHSLILYVRPKGNKQNKNNTLPSTPFARRRRNR